MPGFARPESDLLNVVYRQITVQHQPVAVALVGLEHLVLLVVAAGLVGTVVVTAVMVVSPLLTFRCFRRACTCKWVVSTFPQQRNR